MCGICGIIYNDKSKCINKKILSEMNNSLIHRGPDEDGYFISNNVGLGMRRLSIIDVKGGHQPIYNEDKTICVICNGEIYNHQELRENLEKQGHNFFTHSDVEAIVHLYENFEEDFVHKLRGMFSIAIYDLKEDKLILARDRLGIKPLYYTYQNGAFLFGSELKAILSYPGLEKNISIASISDYLTYLYIPVPDTIFEGIYKLPPAYMLIFSQGSISLKQYWEINYRKEKINPEEYYIERLRDLLKESVRMHLMSEVPLGAFLSGGMDSSTVVALMSEVMDEPVKTFSVGFDVSDFNELKYAKLVAKRFNTDHHEINLSADIINLLPKIVAQFDEPFADSSSIPTYLISQFAKQYVTVCLSGDGGDELFAGYGWTRRQKFIEDYKRLPARVRNIIKNLLLGSNYLPDRKSKFLDKFKRFVYDADLDLDESYMRRVTCFSEGMKKLLFKKQFFEKVKNYNSSTSIEPYFEFGNIRNSLEKLLFVDTKLFLPDDCLCKVDRMSMLHSLEVRVPFLDHKVVEFVATVPFRYKMRGFTSKYILKKIMKDSLPPQVLRQRKLGFTIPLSSWFRGKLGSFINEILLSSNAGANQLFNREYIIWLLNEHISGKQDFGYQIYTLLVLEIWLENFYSCRIRNVQSKE
jgi:asparagine synthase (glutamine-hydrolysing)